MTEKIVLAYSGGLDTSVAIPWLKDKGYEVIAVVLNVGQPNADFDAIQQKALNVGALDSIVVDAQMNLPITMLPRSLKLMPCTKATIRWFPPYLGH